MAGSLRSAVFAGQFYSAREKELKKQLDAFFRAAGKKTNNAPAVVSPHAGYVYSGKVAAHAFSALKKAETYVIISPNHTGIGEAVSVYPEGEWETPLGRVEVDAALSGGIADALGCGFDETAHAGEHSLEVQLPFLQHLCGSRFKIVAITIAEHRLAELKKIGAILHNLTRGRDAGFIASSDFTHFESEERARKGDAEAIALIEKMDIGGFHALVEGKRMSICGYAPVCVVMEACRLGGIKHAELLKYGTSAEESGDFGNVVGYAAIAFRGR
ncbi:MAG: AmmeMemoRadiSam system protein B [Candidatus Diapherotrites archaeon]